MIYPGRFTFEIECLFYIRPLADALTHQLNFLILPNHIYTIPGGKGYVSVPNIKSYIYGIPLYKYAP